MDSDLLYAIIHFINRVSISHNISNLGILNFAIPT